MIKKKSRIFFSPVKMIAIYIQDNKNFFLYLKTFEIYTVKVFIKIRITNKNQEQLHKFNY